MQTVLVGLPRSGTTWLSQLVAATPGVAVVHEPDNHGVDPFAHLAHRDLARLPELGATDAAPADYERLWAVAGRGGWPQRGARGTVVDGLRRGGLHRRCPPWLRPSLLRVAATLTAAAPPPGPVLVKSTRAYLATRWLAARPATTVVSTWRHPLNLAPAWAGQGWSGVLAARSSRVRDRFAGTAAWPPPVDVEVPGDLAALGWATAVLTAVQLEDATAAGTTVLHHEALCLDPEPALATLLGTLGRTVAPSTRAALVEADRDGEGFDTHRRRAAEPGRWRERLVGDDLDRLRHQLDRVAAASPVAAAAWQASPAVR